MPPPTPKLSRLESQVMNLLWEQGEASVRQILEAFPEKVRPAYTTVQTILYRLEAKGAIRRTKKIGNAHIFETTTTRQEARRGVVEELLSLFGGRAQPLVAHLIESGKLTAADIDEARAVIRKSKEK